MFRQIHGPHSVITQVADVENSVGIESQAEGPTELCVGRRATVATIPLDPGSCDPDHLARGSHLSDLAKGDVRKIKIALVIYDQVLKTAEPGILNLSIVSKIGWCEGG